MRRPTPWYRKFNDTWCVQLNGKKITLAKGKENKSEAHRVYHRLMAQENGQPPEPAAYFTVAEVCDLFLDWSSKHNDPATYEWYRGFLQDFCDRCGSVSISLLKPFHVTEWLDKHTWNQSSRRAAISCVKRAFNWATDEGRIPQNPVKKVQKPPVLRRNTILAQSEQKAVYDASKGQCFKDFVFAMEETGCRPGEVARVTAAEVDIESGTWTFAKHKTVHKTGKPRVVYLTAPMIALCRELIAKYPEGPIFRNRHGRPWTRNSIRCRFRNLRKKLKLTGVVAYTLRHTYATDALVNGVDPISLCELLGHTDVSMLMKHYQHLAKKSDHLRKAAERARRPA